MAYNPIEAQDSKTGIELLAAASKTKTVLFLADLFILLYGEEGVGGCYFASLITLLKMST